MLGVTIFLLFLISFLDFKDNKKELFIYYLSSINPSIIFIKNTVITRLLVSE